MAYGGILFHQRLVSDRVRTEAYRKAISSTVKEGDVVLDIGTGSGILALLACESGAARVYAVDSHNIIDVARRLAEDNGFADRIIFLKDDIRKIQLPESVDLITSELISKSLIGQRMEELVSLCRDRFLKPGGKIIPHRVELMVAPLSLDEQEYQRLLFPDRDVYDLDFSSANKLALNTPHSIFSKVKYLSDPQVAYVLDSNSVTLDQHPDAQLRFEIEQEAILHGFVPWFKAFLTPAVVLENRPPGLRSWDNLFFPIQRALAVKAGMICRLRLRARHVMGSPVVWDWSTEIFKGDELSGYEAVANFRQSSLADSMLEEGTVIKLHSTHQPVLNELGEQLRLILDHCDGGKTVNEIAGILYHRYPEGWKTAEDAEDLVHGLLLSLYLDGYAG
jgi:type I protein arginine methyltransferase